MANSQVITREKLSTTLFFVLTLFLAVVVFSIALFTRQTTLSELEHTAGERMRLYQGTLLSALEKYRYLPYFISRDDSVLNLFTGGPGQSRTETVNSILKHARQKSGCAALFIMDDRGRTKSASNWDTPLSFVGHHYGFRPYFKDAMVGKEGQFYAIGATTGTPGYFMSHPIVSGDTIKGVVVVKVDLSGLQNDWRDGGEIVFVSDTNGVIFLSSRDEWKYKSLNPLDHKALDKIRQGRQYKGISLESLSLKKGRSGRHHWVSINNEKFLWTSLALTDLNWQLNYLVPWQQVEERVNAWLYISTAIGVLLILGLLFARERTLKNISQQKALEAETIGRINEKLRQEVEERKRTEAHLRLTQEELVQSGKLAALGQMAAAIVHELNQPIAAVRTYAASCRIMVGRDRDQELKKTLFSVSQITDRMEAITRQLKNFSRKSPLKVEPLDVRDPVQKAVDLLRYAVSDADCVLSIQESPSPLQVMGDGLRLEQIFINLLKNSLDAMADQEDKAIAIEFMDLEDQIMVKISDTGPGVNPGLHEKIFQPFFTTRQKGGGLGLGLSISLGIVKDMAGDLQVTSPLSGGAVFTVSLKKICPQKVCAQKEVDE